MLAGSLLGAWEFLLLLVVMLILLGAKQLPNLRQTWPGHDDGFRSWRRFGEIITVWLAQGFGAGRAPFAPGTFGSLVGLLWLMALVSAGNFWSFCVGILLGVALSVVVCGDAEKILKQHDPPSVVLDEIAAVPICFLPWVAVAWYRFHAMPAAWSFFDAKHWIYTVIIFVLFRFFDVAKPWPVRQSQRLPGGWGVTVDDVLAAIYVALISLVVAGKAAVP
jgi:phosphatidylglycerophosphatase A